MTLRRSCLLFALLPAAVAAAPPRAIDVDAAHAAGPTDTVWRLSVGGDRAAIHLRPTDQRDLKFAHDQCGFEYVRFHGLLDDEMHVVSGPPTTAPATTQPTDDAPLAPRRCDWSAVDAVYDAVRAAGVRPFVELGFMPGPLASGPETIFYYRGNTTPPRSYRAWGELTSALVHHLTDRYGADEVRRWYFEVWNEPNLSMFWHGSQADYFHLYDVTAAAVKAVDPAFRVGGPATAGIGDAWVPAFIAHCHDAGVPVDFVSTHAYGVNAGALDADGTAQLTLDPKPDAVVRQVARVADAVRASALPTLPVFVTEWSASYTPRDPVHDSYLAAPYILSRLARTPAGVAGMSYWTYSDQFEENGPVPSPFHGGFGLLNAQGLPKPAFYAYRFLNQLGPTRLACADPGVRAARDAAGNVQVLLWDYAPPAHQDQPDQRFYNRDWPAEPAPPADVTVRLPAGDYTAAGTRVGYRHNDVYTAYVDAGKPAGLSADHGLLPQATADKLRAACDGAPEWQRPVHVDAGQPWHVQLPMNHNDVYLLTLARRP